MRLKSLALGMLLPVAAILTGCGAGNVISSGAASTSAHSISGTTHGGQFPVTDATIAVYAFGNSGYGSAGTLLATATTDSQGYFTIDPSQINCPSATTPVYILSLGGNPGIEYNSAIALGAGLGNCGDIADAYVTINEISTAALAYTFSRFFGTSVNDGTTFNHFGAPASATGVIINANSGTLPTLLDIKNSYPHPNTSTFTFEGSKLITLANIIGACVNTNGRNSSQCEDLFAETTPPGGNTPVDTLEAAVAIAQNPTNNVQALFNLQPASEASAFDGGLASAPADWTLSVSYASPSFGLGVNTRTASTIDIDTSGRVWFPSNVPGNAGVGFFDPASGSFSQLFPGSLTHPQQVAIDRDGYVWASDTASSNVAGFPAATPNNPVVLSLAGSTSTSISAATDNTMRVGIVAADGAPGVASITGKSTYSADFEVAGGNGFIVASLATDVNGGIALAGQELSTPTTYDLYYNNGGTTFITYQTFQDAGQVVFTGDDYVGTRGGYAAGADGICIWSSQGCYGMANDAVRHPSGISIDGNSNLWLADNNTNSIEQILYNAGTGSYYNSSNVASNTVYPHDANNGGTLPAPSGIAVDRAGNVWVSNAGCSGDNCTPGSFVLSEIIGAGAATITPVSLQVTSADLAGTSPTARLGHKAR